MNFMKNKSKKRGNKLNKLIDKLQNKDIKLSLQQSFVDESSGEILKEKKIKLEEPKFKFKSKGNRYTKSWHCEDLILSKSTYYKYFHYIERRLEMSTNRIIIHTEPSKENIPISKKDLCEITSSSKRTIDDFMNECIEKKYIALMEINKKFFGYIVNPLYMMNGSNLNIFLYIIFGGDEKFISHISNDDLIKLNNYISLVGKVY